jgi:glucose/arabinose dehydrogenase
MRGRSLVPAVVAVVVIVPLLAVGATPEPVVAATVPPGFTDSAVATVDSPTTVEVLPTGQLVVLEQSGALRVGFPGEPLRVVHRFTDLCSGSERGLLGFTHDPGYSANRWVYVYRTRVAPAAPGGCVNRVSRFTLRDGIDPASEVVLLDGISAVGGNHNGGDLDIGSDGMLYVAVGDAGRDPRGISGSAGNNAAARDLSLLNGKILRVTTDGRPAPGNPFNGEGTAVCARRGNLPSTPTTRCREIYAWGLRNPYRFAFDRNDGSDRFFINDVGQATREEVNEGGVGRDYGWNLREGRCPRGQYSATCAGPPPGLTDPITDYGRDVGTYITAGAFVPNGLWPAGFDGGYLFADGGSGRIFLRTAGGQVDYGAPFATGAFGITDMTFAFDENGRLALYYVLISGEVRRIVWTGATAAPTPADLRFVAAGPDRVHDTRDATGGPAGRVHAGSIRRVRLAPPAGARAALVNITVTETTGPGFLQAWHPRSPRPDTSVINVAGADVVANSAVVTLDATGSFVFFASTTGEVVIDLMGWFTTTSGPVSAGRFEALDPARLVDTREPAGDGNAFARSGGRFDIPVVGRLGIPADGTAASVAVILTALGEPGRRGYAGAYPGGTPWPGTSNVNVNQPVDRRANLAVVPLGADGSISVATLNIADIVIDVLGYVTSGSAPSSTAGRYTAVSPVRLVDTRVPVGFGTLDARQVASVSVRNRTGG